MPAAHATDGGGSIRIPASHCGLFGLKPTRGRNPAGPDVGEGWSGLAGGHAVTRSVRDSAALLDATSGPAPGDPYWAPPRKRPFIEEVGADPGRLRIALNVEHPSGGKVSAETRGAAEAAAKLLEGLGHSVEHAAPTLDIEGALRAIRTIIARESRRRDRLSPGGRWGARNSAPAMWRTSPRCGRRRGGVSPPPTMPRRSRPCTGSGAGSAPSSSARRAAVAGGRGPAGAARAPST